ncbi:MAG: tryptophan synthase subunit alpha [Candidatus Omnitrophota bacterium]|nr:MAG: tryptophan synthase subunit alpha [Candidatus Omnitrophota bacterium]
MGKLEAYFNKLEKDNKKAFIVYVPFGFPTIELSKRIIKLLSTLKVDLIEIGLPFSDPLADGPIIEKATQIALRKGATPEALFTSLKNLVPVLSVPVVILSYYNPIYVFGVRKFLKGCREIGVAGVMIVDLPVEEATLYIKEARKLDLDTVFFVTPTTEEKRAERIMEVSRGFVYYISVTGITGPKDLSPTKILANIRKLKRIRNIPICVGFGIHRKSQVKKILNGCEGIIVGSAIVNYIAKYSKDKNFFKKLPSYIRRFYV